jgi:hypothetical protein
VAVFPAGWLITGWTGCATVSADKRTCTVGMTSAKTVTASYQPAAYALTARTAGLNGAAQGTLTSFDTEPDIACAANTGTCIGSAPNGSTVTLVASVPERSLLVSWTGCATVSADKRTCTVTMNMARTVTANYQPTTYLVTTRALGSGQGEVRSSDTEPPIACGTGLGFWMCAGEAPNGSTVTLTAIPRANTSSIVSSWSGCTTVSADKSTCTLTMTANRSVNVTFGTAPVALP